MSVPATIAPMLGKLIPRLSSNFDAEVVSTVRAIERVLRANGRDFHDLAAAIYPPIEAQLQNSDWRRTARFCGANAARLTEREMDFLATVARWRGEPSQKQRKWLRDIADRLRGGT
jgi:hypothetical protein